jgi:NTP pyrophosphatase (non-canonical NTP hydrolase)
MQKTMNFENLVQMHSLQPNNELYNSNAFCGECGEVANLIKKMQFEKIKPEWVGDGICSIPDLKKAIGDELGDCLFYLTRLALDNGFSLSNLIEMQAHKLNEQSIKYKRNFLK